VEHRALVVLVIAVLVLVDSYLLFVGVAYCKVVSSLIAFLHVRAGLSKILRSKVLAVSCYVIVLV
jgi:hypothetical protein